MDQNSRLRRLSFSFVRLLCAPWLAFLTPLHAAESNVSSPEPGYRRQSLTASSVSAVYVHPSLAPANSPRTIFFVDSRSTACNTQTYSFDASVLQTENVVNIQFDLNPTPCGVRPLSYPTYKAHTITPTKVGKLIVRATRNGQVETVDATVSSGSAIRSRRNVNGMWFDPATGGSGISLHHSPASDSVFGTWFMFHRDGSPRWYTMQQTVWTGSGDSLEGLLIGTSGGCPDDSLFACPGIGAARTLPVGTYNPITPYANGDLVFDAVIARFTFTSDTAAIAEVTDFARNVLFSSRLVKLQF